MPIEKYKQQLQVSIKKNNVVIISASPGSGKTTMVPLMMDEIFENKIAILEPRKLAAKMASLYLKKQYCSEHPQKIGHQFRFEKNVTEASKIIFYTEGTFLKILQQDPKLLEYDLVVLDEFHERHLSTDITLAYLLEIQKTRPELKIIIMSGTINLRPLEQFLQAESVYFYECFSLEEKKHQLHLHYLKNDTVVLKQSLKQKVLSTLLDINQQFFDPAKPSSERGDILIFLPGMAVINELYETIEQNLSLSAFKLYRLHGELGADEIHSALFQATQAHKIILATNIAESSITLPDLTFILDSGLEKKNEIDPKTHIPSLELKRISKASAIQRAHRAGRVKDGHVYRLYSEMQFLESPDYAQLDIHHQDLLLYYLLTAQLFNKNFRDLPLLDKPSSYAHQKFLAKLEMFNLATMHKDAIELTPMGACILQTNLDYRMGKFLVLALKGRPEFFLKAIQYAFSYLKENNFALFSSQVKNNLSKDDLESNFESYPFSDKTTLEELLFYVFHDHIAELKHHRGEAYFIHREGVKIAIAPQCQSSLFFDHPLWIITKTNQHGQVLECFPVEDEWLYNLPIFPIEEIIEYKIDPQTYLFKQHTVFKIGALKIDEQIISMSADLIRTKCAQEKNLLKQLHELITLHLLGDKNNLIELGVLYSELRPYYLFSKDIPLHKLLLEAIDASIDYLPFQQLKEDCAIIQMALHEKISQHLNLSKPIDQLAPRYLTASNGKNFTLNYETIGQIKTTSFIQDFYGLEDFPTIQNQLVTIEILGPHKRPIQTTTSLKNFWKTAYREMFKEHTRNYPRHYWPQEPEKAKPYLLLRLVPN